MNSGTITDVLLSRNCHPISREQQDAKMLDVTFGEMTPEVLASSRRRLTFRCLI